jgi:RNA polymerase sigma-70 factor, ECF subfamily
VCMGEKQLDFEELLLPHLDGAYNLARWLIEEDQGAEAVVREAYIQAVKEVAEFPEADARSRLLKIVRNIAYLWIQNRGKYANVIRLAGAYRGELPTAAPSNKSDQPVVKASRQEWNRPLQQALSKLPVELREILVLHDIEGWTYTQLSSVLEISRATVLNRLNTARQSLRQALGEAHRRELNDG